MSASVPEAMRARLDEYGQAHRTHGNEVCHFLGVPLIVLGAGGLLGAVKLGLLGSVELTLAHLVLAGVLTFYLVQARWLGLITALLILLLAGLGTILPVWLGLLAFLFGWAIQFLGHARYERRSPAFMQNLVHLLIGPAWLVERALFR